MCTNNGSGTLHDRIAEAVGAGWPAYRIEAADVAEITERDRTGRPQRFGRNVVEAVLAEASTHGS